MRLFIAALLDERAVSELSRLRDALHDASSAGSFVPRENLHITLGRHVMASMRCGRIDRLEATVESVSLMLSERSASGMVYTELFANRG